MPHKRRENPKVREFILRNVEGHPTSISSIAAKEFGLSRTAINGYTRRLIDDGFLRAQGVKRGRRYELRTLVSKTYNIQASAGTSEDAIWRFRILPLIKNVNKNVIDILQYGFTEMLNNVLDHSASKNCIIYYTQNYCNISIFVIDYGIGIFQKIQQTFGLDDHRSALLELSKGKITSYKSKHTGEGIFFTSRMFDKFTIRSGNLFYLREKKDNEEWLIESGDLPKERKGTGIIMTISTDATWTQREVFQQYMTDPIRFRKTHVPIKLGNYPGEELVSRSQAKRILARFDQFSEVMLDFDSVLDIGQAFADEIFRVFRQDHPEIELYAINLSPDVKRMIDYVVEVKDTQGKLNFLVGSEHRRS